MHGHVRKGSVGSVSDLGVAIVLVEHHADAVQYEKYSVNHLHGHEATPAETTPLDQKNLENTRCFAAVTRVSVVRVAIIVAKHGRVAIIVAKHGSRDVI